MLYIKVKLKKHRETMGKMISATFEVDTKIYPMEAIYSAAYTFIDRAYIYLSGNPKGSIRVNFRPKSRAYNFEDIRGEFMNELLSCSLRNQISEKNHKIREYIVGAALLGASGEIPHLDEIENENANIERRDDEDEEECDCDCGCESDDYHYDEETDAFKAENNSWEDDPFGIAVPWEDKYPTSSSEAEKPKEEKRTEQDDKPKKNGSDLIPGEDGIIDVSDDELAKYATLWEK